MGVLGMVTGTNAAAGVTGTNPSLSPIVPHPKLRESIDLSNVGPNSWVQLLTFSPDSRYLAIVDNPEALSSTIIIWDLRLNREQTRIARLPPFGGYPHVKLLWSPDGKYITFGAGRPMLFWDPLTGNVARTLLVDPPVLWSRYNKNGTKLLVNREPLNGHGGFRIYDTTNWKFRDYADEGLLIQGLSWTATDKILVAGEWPRFSVGRMVDGIVPKMADALARLIDPSGRQMSRSILLAPSAPRQLKGFDHPILVQTFWPDWSTVNYRTDKIALGLGKIVDGHTLEVLTFATDEDILSGKIPVGGQVFSADGNYLYLLGTRLDGKAKSLVIDVRTGSPVGTFPGGKQGLAASADGKWIAVGNGRSIDLYSLE